MFPEADALLQIGKARVSAQGIETGIDLEIDKTYIVRAPGVFEPSERLVAFAEAGIDQGNFISADSVFSHVVFQ